MLLINYFTGHIGVEIDSRVRLTALQTENFRDCFAAALALQGQVLSGPLGVQKDPWVCLTALQTENFRECFAAALALQSQFLSGTLGCLLSAALQRENFRDR